MTLILGIKCRDGIVMAADSAATLSDGVNNTVGQQAVTKLHDLGGVGIYASTGALGASQQICNAIRKLLASGTLAETNIATAEDAMIPLRAAVGGVLSPLFEGARNILPLVGQQRAGESILCKSLVAIRVGKKRIPALYQVAESGAPELVDPKLSFVALGSGQLIADPFLALLKRVLWSDREPSVADGRFVAAWTISHVAKTNTGGVGLPLQLATLTVGDKDVVNISFADAESLGEHLQAVEQAEETLRQHIFGRRGDHPAAEIPSPVGEPSASVAVPGSKA